MKHALFIGLFSLIIISTITRLTLNRSDSIKDLSSGSVIFKHIIDGDTIVVEYEGRVEKVRLIGINTPEIHHPTIGVAPFGIEAKRFVEDILKPGDRVKLDFDLQLRDKYGRILAYVFLADGRFLNALLVENGYAQVMTIPPNLRYQELFLRLQREARENKRGLWSGKGLDNQPPQDSSRECNFVASRLSEVFHKPDCEWAKKIKDWNRQCFGTRENAIKAGKRSCRVCRP